MIPSGRMRSFGSRRSAAGIRRKLCLAARASFALPCVAAGCADEGRRPALPKPAQSSSPAAVKPQSAPVLPTIDKPKPDAVSIYFPHAEGNRWEMEMKGEDGSEKLTLEILKSSAAAGEGSFLLETRRGSRAIQRDCYVADEKGLSFVSSGIAEPTRIEPPMPILRIPVNSGDRWDWIGKFRTGGSTGNARSAYEAQASFTVGGPDKVKTIAGEFEAFRIEQRVVVHVPNQDTATNTTLWYAPKIGLIKQVVESPTTKGEAVLISYRLNEHSAAQPGQPSQTIQTQAPIAGRKH